jgi:hypothetical protein
MSQKSFEFPTQPITVTVRYLDQNSGSNRPFSHITQTLRAVPQVSGFVRFH